MKSKLIKILNNFIFYTKLYNLFSTRQKVVLLYHRINKKEIIQNYYLKSIFVSDKNFEKQMKWLSNSKRKNKVIITFDDGYKDNYKYAFPVLRKFNLKAIFFITTNFIEKRQYMWIDILNNYATLKNISMEEFRILSKKVKSLSIEQRKQFLKPLIVENNLKNDNSMDWEQLKDMKDNGQVIANHTMNHPNFSRETKEIILKEIKITKEIIEKKLNIKDMYFAYPDGDVGSKETLEILKELGYKYAFRTKRGIWNENKNNNLLINRIPIYYWDDLATFVNKIHGINIEDNFSFKVILIKILEIIGIKEWVKKKLKS